MQNFRQHAYLIFRKRKLAGCVECANLCLDESTLRLPKCEQTRRCLATRARVFYSNSVCAFSFSIRQMIKRCSRSESTRDALASGGGLIDADLSALGGSSDAQVVVAVADAAASIVFVRFVSSSSDSGAVLRMSHTEKCRFLIFE